MSDQAAWGILAGMKTDPDGQKDVPRLRGFLNDDGSNPFTESEPERAEAESGRYEVPYQPGDYVTRMRHRRGLILGFGIVGIVPSGILSVDILSSGRLYSGVPNFTSAALVFALFFGLTTWILGSRDLKAMSAGVMDGAGKRWTTTGVLLGVLGLLTCFLWLGITVFQALTGTG